MTSKLWAYIKEHKLQDEKKKTLINADAKLKAVFDGKAQVTMFEMNKLVNNHVKNKSVADRRGVAVRGRVRPKRATRSGEAWLGIALKG